MYVPSPYSIYCEVNGMSKLEEFISNNDDKISAELMNELTEIYDQIQKDTHENDAMIDGNMDEVMHYMDFENKYKSEMGDIKEELERVRDKLEFTDREDTEDCEMIMEEAVSEIKEIEKDYGNEEFEQYEDNNTNQKEKEVKDKMRKLGFVFKDDMRNIYNSQTDKSLNENMFYNAVVEKSGDNTYNIKWNNTIDAYYNIATKKVKGKGSIKYKEKIVNTIEYYQNCKKYLKGVRR